MIKKIFFTICILLLVIGCSSKFNDGNKIEVEFWTLQLADYKDYIQNIINEYEEAHPRIKIIWRDVPFKEGEKRTLAASLSNRVPDLVNLNPSFSSTLASRKALVNINDYITKEQKGEYLESSWQASSIDNFVFGIPWYITSSITIYNKDDLSKSGINLPASSFNDLIDQSKVIKDKLDKYAFYPTFTDGDYFLKLFFKNGVDISKLFEGGKSDTNKVKAEQILSKWVNFYNSGLISPESIVTNHQEAVDKFQSGVSSYIIIGPNFLNTIKDNSPKLFDSIEVSRQIVGTSQKVDFSLMNLIVPIKSTHKKEAIDFALFLTNAKNQLAFSKLTPTLPSNIEALNNSYFNDMSSKNIEDRARVISAQQLKLGAKTLPLILNQQEMIALTNYYVQKAMLKKISCHEAIQKLSNH